MKKINLLLAMALGLFAMLTITAETASATNWIELPGTDGLRYIDADSAVKQGNTLIYWFMKMDSNGRFQGVPVSKSLAKVVVDLHTPRRSKWVLVVYFDANDQQIGSPFYNPNQNDWENASSSQNQYINFVLPYAKERQDTGAIPAAVSDH